MGECQHRIWFDYDRDGLLDLFLGGYYSEDVDLWHLKTTKMMPESFEYAKNGGRKYLFHNLGDGKFEEVSAKARHRHVGAGRWPRPRLTCAARVIRISSSPTTMEFRNCTSTTANSFAKLAKQTGVGFAPKSGMNAAFGDVLNQGRYVDLRLEHF